MSSGTPPAAPAAHPPADRFFQRALRVAMGTAAAAAIVTRSLAEILFPVGCSTVIYMTERASRMARLAT